MLRVARAVAAVLVLAAVVLALVRTWHSVGPDLARMPVWAVLASVGFVLLGLVPTLAAWRTLLSDLGSDLAVRPSVGVFFVGQLGKYLPGSVWSFLLQAQLGRKYQVPRARALVTLVLSAGLAIATALTLSVFAISPLLGSWGPVAWLLVLGPLALLMAVPRVMTWLSNTLLRIMRRPMLDQPIIARQIPWAIAWSVVSWLLFGLQLWGLASSLGELSFRNYLLVTGVFALAMSAGFIAFVLPSGVGVREAVIVAGLAPILPTGPALAFALTSRLIFTVADVSSALIAVVIARGVNAQGAELGGALLPVEEPSVS